ncbi:tRNA pseudouridine(13) synthase TruD [Roseomonas hellenica]|uniref:tRNA pseudouridine(13) synthase TruD n=1 Tax=Plastoroseomonas hellenica TaxID=2687306 RepID=A0ABS5EUM5_9PROT|nr:tRNA pseudouridine(13) synthase TruD [Plastoroseomonas hellenica]MBR0664001.1 tRNA pseudouridine(13) synthase TruD [Plastoroseomonas hellenica]
MDEPIVKYSPSDFLVVENLVLPEFTFPAAGHYDTGDEAPFTYLRAQKSGYTTFELMGLLSRFFCLPTESVTYAGLKDEDGITEQTVCIAARITQKSATLFNSTNRTSAGKFVRIYLLGYGSNKIEIGKLNGNGFRITIRKISQKFADTLPGRGKMLISFLNYYDTQRFGIPNNRKNTHRIGEAILNGDFRRALVLVRESGTPEGKIAVEAQMNDAEKFFECLEPRIISFYKSSFASFEWNSRLAKEVRKSAHEFIEKNYEGIEYTFSKKSACVSGMMASMKSMPMKKYYGDMAISERPTAIQTQIHFDQIEEDEVHVGFYKISVSFFLPSGTYATMCLKQILNFGDIRDVS